MIDKDRSVGERSFVIVEMPKNKIRRECKINLHVETIY